MTVVGAQVGLGAALARRRLVILALTAIVAIDAYGHAADRGDMPPAVPAIAAVMLGAFAAGMTLIGRSLARLTDRGPLVAVVAFSACACVLAVAATVAITDG